MGDGSHIFLALFSPVCESALDCAPDETCSHGACVRPRCSLLSPSDNAVLVVNAKGDGSPVVGAEAFITCKQVRKQGRSTFTVGCVLLYNCKVLGI